MGDVVPTMVESGIFFVSYVAQSDYGQNIYGSLQMQMKEAEPLGTFMEHIKSQIRLNEVIGDRPFGILSISRL